MTRLDRQIGGAWRWALAGSCLLALAWVLAWGPMAVRADEPALTAASLGLCLAGPADKPLTLTLDPNLIAMADADKPADKPADKAAEGQPAAAAAPDLTACPPGVHTPPPLPLFNVEGLPGTLLVPMAYPINCESVGTTVGMPTVGYTFVRAGSKTVEEVHLSETFFRRFEVGYTMGTLDLGSFPTAVKRATTIDIGFQHVVLHNFNLSAKVVDETEYIPAVMAAVTFKYNPDVMAIDRRLGGAVRSLGLAHDNSEDYTLTATKTVIDPFFKRPVMLTGGIRFSEAAQLGYLGFGNAYRMTGEGSVVYMPTDWLAVAYEYRQKKDPYDSLGNLVRREGSWQAVDVGFILNPHLTFAVGWLCAGNLANGRADNGWGFQLKYEF